ncbi:diaminopimelate decarboxylase [Lentzea sp. NPDC058436]|uniref:diaminopimelate decarboxylase n=1 Tax=Lentzea sp. NPDC058436 TaxID=3346499 RepID=UPI00365AA199
MSLDFSALAAEFGTPLYVYDGDVLLEDFATLRALVPGPMEIFYSLKANPNITVFDLLRRRGARAEVSSLAEPRTALAAGAAPEDIIFLGPGKTEAELAACVDAGVYSVVAESFAEVELIDQLAARRDVVQRVMLRINPARPPSAARLVMGGKPRQFGVDEDLVLGSGSRLAEYRHAAVRGVHAYLGTRFLDAKSVVDNTRYVLDLALRVAEKTGILLDVVDVGGGLGVPYFDNESALDTGLLTTGLGEAVAEFLTARPGTRLIMEAGRFPTAGCGTYVVSVRSVKRSFGENFAVTDGGTHQHMTAVGIGSVIKRNFPVELLSRASAAPAEPWHVTGPLCTPSDVIAKAAPLPELREGDLVGVLMSGAYGPTASPGLFLGHGHPAEVVVLGGEARLVRARDTVEDVLSHQILCDFSTTTPIGR